MKALGGGGAGGGGGRGEFQYATDGGQRGAACCPAKSIPGAGWIPNVLVSFVSSSHREPPAWPASNAVGQCQ